MNAHAHTHTRALFPEWAQSDRQVERKERTVNEFRQED